MKQIIYALAINRPFVRLSLHSTRVMIAIFYTLLNAVYRILFGGRYMLHAPLFHGDTQTLLEAQAAFADHCVSFLGNIQGKRVLDVGCGSGMQTLHLLEHCKPTSILGVDVVASQITLARRHIPSMDNRIRFETDDAQVLRTVDTGSMDAVICLESALHYPDKHQFLLQASRVLAPGGQLLVADLLVQEEQPRRSIGAALYLHNWTHGQYLRAFEQTGFKVNADLSLNAIVFDSFGHARAAIGLELQSRGRFAAFFKMLLIRPALALYAAQLRRFDYRLFVCSV